MRGAGRSVVRSAVAGALAGLAASYVMNAFQEGLSRVSPSSDGGGDDPSTVKAAERLAGRELSPAEKPAAGGLVHYAFGALLGLAYGSAAAVLPAVSAGFGLPYGLAVALVADEVLVPAARLSGPPTDSPASTHAYTVASHLVFGAVLEGVRRVLSRVL